MSGEQVIPWAHGKRGIVQATYSYGYTTIPGALELAATEEVRHRFHQSPRSGRDALGVETKSFQTGGQTAYRSGAFLDSTIEAMRAFLRVA
jgi:hypothetical protein